MEKKQQIDKKGYITVGRNCYIFGFDGEELVLPKIPGDNFIPRSDDVVIVSSDIEKNESGIETPVTNYSIENKYGEVEATYTVFDNGLIQYQRNKDEYFMDWYEYPAFLKAPDAPLAKRNSVYDDRTEVTTWGCGVGAIAALFKKDKYKTVNLPIKDFRCERGK